MKIISPRRLRSCAPLRTASQRPPLLNGVRTSCVSLRHHPTAPLKIQLLNCGVRSPPKHPPKPPNAREESTAAGGQEGEAMLRAAHSGAHPLDGGHWGAAFWSPASPFSINQSSPLGPCMWNYKDLIRSLFGLAAGAGLTRSTVVACHAKHCCSSLLTSSKP